MGFWNRSEDPWDRDPARERERRERASQERGAMENPLDSLRAWNEQRKAEAAEKAAKEAAEPAEKCPWCGKDMEQGFLTGGRDGTHWYPGIYKTDLFRGLDSTGRIDVLDEGGIWSGLYKTAWLCRDCKKAVFNMPDPPEIYEPFAPRPEAEETKEEETSEE